MENVKQLVDTPLSMCCECEMLPSGQCLGCGANGLEEPCETCGGEGEVSTMEQVYPGEPHMAPIGTAPCPDCNLPEPDYE